MQKYQSLNVLNQRSFLDDYNRDAVNEVTAMVNSSGNRSTRRRIEKALSKTTNITKHADKRATERANRELANKADLDLVWLYATVGLVLMDSYHWKQDPDQEHGQIEGFFDRLTAKMNEFNEKGLTVEEVAVEFERRTGIELRVK